MNNDRHKFRVWDSERNEYLEADWGVLGANGTVYQILPPESGTTGLLRVDSRRYTIEQCTGLRDRNGKLIYEGDVLVISPYNPANEKFAVVWSDGEYALEFMQYNDYATSFVGNASKFYVVVGNIHEVKDE